MDAQGQLHLIDFGNANGKGRPYILIHDGNCCPWLAPEVYSAGFMLQAMSILMTSGRPVEGLAQQLMREEPHKRTSLPKALLLLRALGRVMEGPQAY